MEEEHMRIRTLHSNLQLCWSYKEKCIGGSRPFLDGMFPAKEINFFRDFNNHLFNNHL